MGDDLHVVFCGQVVVYWLVEASITQLSEALCDIVGTVLYDRGAALVSGFDHYVGVRREFLQRVEMVMFYVFLSGACWYAVLQAQLVHGDYCFESAATHRGVVSTVGLEFKTIGIIERTYTGPFCCFTLIILEMTF